MVTNITGRSTHDEARSEGKTYDVVAGVRATRMRWLGRILQMDDGRMVLQATKTMYENRRDGDLLMDVPETGEWEELRAMATAGKGKVWQQLVRQIKDMVHIQTAKEKSGSKKRKQQKKRKTKKKKKKANGSDAEAGASSAAASATARREEDDEDSEDEDGGWVIK